MKKLTKKTFILYYKDGKEQLIKGLNLKDALASNGLGVKVLTQIYHYDEK